MKKYLKSIYLFIYNIMKLLTIIVYLVAFAQFSYSIFFDFCLISLFCTSAYSYDLTLTEPKNDLKTDPIVSIFYITKYLLHFIYHFLRKQKQQLMELKNDNIQVDEDIDCEDYCVDYFKKYGIIKLIQYIFIRLFEWYDLVDNYYTEVIVIQSVSFIQRNFIRLFTYIVTKIISRLGSKSLPTFDVWQTNNSLKENINMLDLELDADIEIETESETEETKKTN
jgi:hypothetical protein